MACASTWALSGVEVVLLGLYDPGGAVVVWLLSSLSCAPSFFCLFSSGSGDQMGSGKEYCFW